MKGCKREVLSRRNFLKGTLTGAAVLGLGPVILSRRTAEAFPGGTEVHPNISSLRVVGIHDPGMTIQTEDSVYNTWSAQEKFVQAEAVHRNLDKLAISLAEEKKVDDAWKKIFLKPAGKSWGDVVVAIKTNNIAQQHTRSPVLEKICRVLTGTIGIKGSNIFIYDACHGSGMAKSTPFSGLPEGVQVVDRWGGYNLETVVPKPWHGGIKRAPCLDHLVKGKVDILVNVALCKGHSERFGKFTQSMKNHFGTFNPRLGHSGSEHDTDYLMGINRAPEILGETDSKTGKVLFPRQQLCIIDALWASEPGPAGLPTVQSNRIFMGVFPPVLDYLVAMRFRRDEMKWSIEEDVVKRFLSEFGFSPSDLPADQKIIHAG